MNFPHMTHQAEAENILYKIRCLAVIEAKKMEMSKDTVNTLQSCMLHWCCTLLTPDVILCLP